MFTLNYTIPQKSDIFFKFHNEFGCFFFCLAPVLLSQLLHTYVLSATSSLKLQQAWPSIKFHVKKKKNYFSAQKKKMRSNGKQNPTITRVGRREIHLFRNPTVMKANACTYQPYKQKARLFRALASVVLMIFAGQRSVV